MYADNPNQCHAYVNEYGVWDLAEQEAWDWDAVARDQHTSIVHGDEVDRDGTWNARR